MVKLWLCAFVQLAVGISLLAQTAVKITIFNEGNDEGSSRTEQDVRAELGTLLDGRYDVTIESLSLDQLANFEQSLAEVEASDTDLIIAVGFEACNRFAAREAYNKPTILAFLLDNELQGVPPPQDGTSGVTNLSYVQSPFDIGRDFEMLYEIKPYEQVAIFVSDLLEDSEFDFDAYLDKVLAFSGASYQVLPIGGSSDAVLQALTPETDAGFVFPVLGEERLATLQGVLGGLAQRGIPTFSLLSSPNLEMGAYAAFDTEDNFSRIPRRVAINAMKIIEGQAAESLPVLMENFTENLLINFQTAKITRHYPSWDIMAEAILLNVAESDEDGGRTMTFQSAIAEGLANNLGIKIAEKEVQISQADVSLARSNYLPQVEALGTVSYLDDNSVRQSFGTRAQYNISATGSLSQLILSEPAMANIAIQKFLLQSQEQSLRESELDVVLDVADAYLGILQATALVKLRNQNVAVTRKNLDIAQAKEKVGFSGTADVYRFESELAGNNVELNTAQAQLRQSRFFLNNLLNYPIKENFALADIEISDSILLATDPRLFGLINNPGDLEVFADFLVTEAFNNLPEIKQVQAALAAQERSVLSKNRSFYLPQVILSGEYNYPVDQFNYPADVMPIDPVTTYNAAVAVQYPIFQGNARRYERQQLQVGALQLKDQIVNLRNGLELQVRSSLETAGASFSNLALSQLAVDASRKNFELAQNSYQQGVLNITSLIDAQNALLQAEINAINAEYTFIADFLAVERSIGYFHNLAVPQEQDAFLQRFVQFITNQE
ncbi:MAG: TolC family protein [Bacteroidota bacterium]